MSKLSDKIFHGEAHRLSSPYGYRKVINTTGGKTSSFHSGADYSTGGIKLPQYAVAEGEVYSCGTDGYGGKYVWISYPSLNVRMLHYHLDTIAVRKGQKVNSETVIGTTGKTGRATGVHLHLGIQGINGGAYMNPETWSETIFEKAYKKRQLRGDCRCFACEKRSRYKLCRKNIFSTVCGCSAKD